MFTLISECLANFMDTNTKFIGLKVNQYQIKFIQWADDIAVVWSNINDLNEALIGIRLFEKGTSSVLNTKKSSLVWPNNKEDNLLNIKIINEEPEKYLGVYINNTGIVSKTRDRIMSLASILKKWNNNNLTFKSRKTIWSSYTLSKIWYYCYTEDYSKEDIKLLNKLESWWFYYFKFNFDSTFNYIPKIAKSRLNKSKYEGGLNIPDIKSRIYAYKSYFLIKALYTDTQSFWKNYLVEEINNLQNLYPNQFILNSNMNIIKLIE